MIVLLWNLSEARIGASFKPNVRLHRTFQALASEHTFSTELATPTSAVASRLGSSRQLPQASSPQWA